MSNIIPRLQDRELTRQSHDILPPRLPSRVQRAIDQEAARSLVQTARAQGAGLTAAARIEAAELVTARAMHGLDWLHRVESAMTKNDPVQAERYSALVEDFLLVARTEVRRLSKEF